MQLIDLIPQVRGDGSKLILHSYPPHAWGWLRKDNFTFCFPYLWGCFRGYDSCGAFMFYKGTHSIYLSTRGNCPDKKRSNKKCPVNINRAFAVFS